MPELSATPRTTLKRKPMRGSYDRDEIYAIIDEAFLASVAVSIGGQPHVQPMLHARIGDDLILHGSAANRMLTHLRDGGEACVNITITDGILFGATVPDHTMNYRSVTVYGKTTNVADTDEKIEIMRAVFETLAPQRWAGLPSVDRGYVEKTTMVLKLPLAEAVAKINTDTPAADENECNVWTGALPVRLAWGPPRAMPVNGRAAPDAPAALAQYRRPTKA